MLYDKLKEHSDSGIYPMHMPGHKRNQKLMHPGLSCDIDITEIHGFDDLRDPKGVLLESSKLAAELYGSREAFLLINGTTVGILAAIGAYTKRGDKILTTDNCHWSIPNAAEIFDLELIYITPGYDEVTGVPCSICPEAVKSALDNEPDICLVVITSPTYEGVVSDISSIAKVVHGAGANLLVDTAHGAHLGFSEAFPESPVNKGADIVVMSLHKTLPALTQCSLLHVCSGFKEPSLKLRKMLNILQTSSPSYILIASIDHCLRLLKSDGDKLFREYEQNLKRFYDKTINLKKLSVLNSRHSTLEPQEPSLKPLKPHRPGFFALDPGKIVIITKNTTLSSTMLSEILRKEYKIETERCFENYVIAMTSICDRPEGFTRLAEALTETDTGV